MKETERFEIKDKIATERIENKGEIATASIEKKGERQAKKR